MIISEMARKIKITSMLEKKIKMITAMMIINLAIAFARLDAGIPSLGINSILDIRMEGSLKKISSGTSDELGQQVLQLSTTL
jgi:hypothetical protein